MSFSLWRVNVTPAASIRQSLREGIAAEDPHSERGVCSVPAVAYSTIYMQKYGEHERTDHLVSRIGLNDFMRL